MSVEDRLTRLERRFMVLEALVRQRLPSVPPIDLVDAEAPIERTPRPVRSATVASPPAPRVAPPASRRSFEGLGAEQWFGQRGVLAVGVLLLILAVAYFLKIAIDRGWISPAARCIAALGVGLAVSGLGSRLHRRGTETFGAALIGAGAGMVYLAVWAASSLYALVSLEVGVIGLAVVSIATSTLAYRLNVEALGAAAALGALFGPVVIVAEASSTDMLLLYLGGVGMGLGVTAVRRQWHATVLLIVATSFLLAMPAVGHAGAILGYAFAVVGGLACLSLRQRWTEIGIIGFLGAWRLFHLIPVPAAVPWVVVVCGFLLAVVIWLDALRASNIWPDGSVVASAGEWSVPESFLFYATPLMVGATIALAFPRWAATQPGAIPLLLAVPYLLVGYLRVGGFQRSRATFALVGTVAAGLAASSWPGAGLAAVITMLGMALLWATLDHLQGRDDGRWYALITLVWAGFRFAEIVRAPEGAAFVDAWALTLWLGVVVTVVLALGLWKVAPSGDGVPREKGPLRYRTIDQELFLNLGRTLPPGVRSLLWTAAGALLFGGVSFELIRMMGQQGFSPEVVRLASGLAVSAWWALFAGALVVLGFSRSLAAARIAGLSVAALAALKVLFVDLASLDQLYRVASFITVAVVLLFVAYLYHRQAARAGTAASSDS